MFSIKNVTVIYKPVLIVLVHLKSTTVYRQRETYSEVMQEMFIKMEVHTVNLMLFRYNECCRLDADKVLG